MNLFLQFSGVQSALGQQEKENCSKVQGKMAFGFLADRKEDGVVRIWKSRGDMLQSTKSQWSVDIHLLEFAEA